MKVEDAKRLYSSNPDHYFLKICEELSELQQAILHFKDGKVDVKDVIEELADVYLQAEKMLFFISDFDSIKTHNNLSSVENVLNQKESNLFKIINSLDQSK